MEFLNSQFLRFHTLNPLLPDLRCLVISCNFVSPSTAGRYNCEHTNSFNFKTFLADRFYICTISYSTNYWQSNWAGAIIIISVHFADRFVICSISYLLHWLVEDLIEQNWLLSFQNVSADKFVICIQFQDYSTNTGRSHLAKLIITVIISAFLLTNL